MYQINVTTSYLRDSWKLLTLFPISRLWKRRLGKFLGLAKTFPRLIDQHQPTNPTHPLDHALTTEMFENLCTLPLSSELFAQALHPKEPILAVGLSGGHVQSFRLPPVAGNDDDEDPDASVLSTGTSTIDTEWRTRRHKGSCRTLAYSFDGESPFSQPPHH
jgi:hypothetical protein